MRKLFLIVVTLLAARVSAADISNTECTDAVSKCDEDEVEVTLKLIGSAAAEGAGWKLTDKNGVDIMSQPADDGYYGSKKHKATPYTYSTCVRKSECGGDDGGDGGKLTLSVTGHGAFDSLAIFVDGVEIMSVVGQSVSSIDVRCSSRPPPTSLSKSPPSTGRRNLLDQQDDPTFLIRPPADNSFDKWEWSLRDSEGVVAHSGSNLNNSSECQEEACTLDAKECYSFTYSAEDSDFDITTTSLLDDDEEFTVKGVGRTRGMLLGQRCMKPNMCQQWRPSLNPLEQTTDRAYDIMQKLIQVSGSDVFSSSKDSDSPQYRAACWVLHEDPLRTMATDLSLIQRYVLRLIIESTDSAERNHWNTSKIDEYTTKHECEWNWIVPHEHEDEDGDEYEYDYYTGCYGEDYLYDYDEDYLDDYFMNFYKFGFFCCQGTIAKIYHWDDNMSGSIPTEISQLSDLYFADFSGNKLNGTIPDEIFSMSRLTILWFDDNNLTGTLSSKIGFLTLLSKFGVSTNLLHGTIPTELFNLEHLHYVDLFENRFEGSLPANACGKAEGLKYLQIRSNNLNGTIPTEIGMCSSLVELNLSRNHLTGLVPSTIQNMNRIKLLDLSNNTLKGIIPAAIGDMTNLAYLDLSNNLFAGSIPKELGSLLKLEFFRLENNNIGGDVPRALCSNFEKQQNTSYFSSDCDRNAEPRVSCRCCNRCFGPFESNERQGLCPSKEIKISTFRKGGYSDPWILHQWSLLDGFGHPISQGGLSQTDRDCFESGGCDIKSSTCISSSACYTLRISRPIDFVPGLYVETWFEGMSLTIHQDGEEDRNITYDIPPYWREDKFDKIEKISKDALCDNIMICGNKFSAGSRKRNIFDKIVKISGESSSTEGTKEHEAACWIINDDGGEEPTNVDSEEMRDYLLLQRYIVALLYHKFGVTNFLNVSSQECNWYGMYCDTDNVTISKIDLAGSNFNGGLFRELGELKFLRVLNLERNNLNGEIPVELTNMWSLEELYLGDNSFSGSIPREIENMGRMKVLNLYNNSFSGGLPLELYNLVKLKTLNMTKNLLGGTIDSTIGNLVSLEKLDLSANFFTGVMPADVFNAKHLTELNLQSNEMTGRIPISNEQNHSSLLHLILNDNKFGSSIPTTIEKLTGLKKLMLDNNRLTGIVPIQLGELKELEIISLSYNELKNNIPTELRKLTSLSEVYLHGNKLVGNADVFSKYPQVYIADCGFPSVTDELILCNGCTVCCNALKQCQNNKQTVGGISPLTFALILLGTFCAFFALFGVSATFIMKDMIPISSLSSLELCGASSVYHFILCDNLVGWTIVVATVMMQFTLFTLFLQTSSFSDKTNSDWVYGMRCPENRDCEDYNDTTWLGWFSFAVALVTYSMKDIVKGVKLIFKATRLVNLRCFISGMVLISITIYGMLASYFYNKAIALSNTEIIVNSVILLFMTDMDEWTHYLIFILKPKWTTKRLQEAERVESDRSSSGKKTKTSSEDGDTFEENGGNTEDGENSGEEYQSLKQS